MLLLATRSLSFAAVSLGSALSVVVAESFQGSGAGLLVLIVVAIVAAGGLALAAIASSRRRHVLELVHERDDRVIDTLQTAYESHAVDLPGARVGATHISSSSETRVGGDTYDVNRIDDRYGYIMVSDVSGKGLAAAADTAMIKYTAAAYAQILNDPAAVVSALNLTFLRKRTRETTFAVVFFAIYDSLTRTLTYCGAGPNPAFVRNGGGVRQLSVTGPVIGLSEEMTFESATLQLEPGDTLVVATDGLTEARDPARAMLGEDGAIRMLRQLDARDPQRLVDSITRCLVDFSGGALNDDLALLAFRIDGESREPREPAPMMMRRPIAAFGWD